MTRVTQHDIEKFKTFKFDTSKYIVMNSSITRDVRTGALILKEQKPLEKKNSDKK
jgi:hypothetical protein